VSEEHAIVMVREMLQLTLFLSAPILLAAVFVGLVVGVLQAMTQVQEQTLAFVPKILGMGVITALSLPWLFRAIMFFSERMFASL